MLSVMETNLGLVVVGPKGQTQRIPRGHPAFASSRSVVNGSLPAEQAWEQLEELMSNPLKALTDWLSGFGLSIQDEGDSIRVQDMVLSKMQWLPLLQRAQQRKASPVPVVQFAEKLGTQAFEAPVSQIVLQTQTTGDVELVQLARVKQLPDAARRGDIVTPSSVGPATFLVGYEDVWLEDGQLQVGKGVVLRRLDQIEKTEILTEPVILGDGRTYKCVEGDKAGWLEDLSFDTLAAAERNIKDIRSTGSEARIINRISNQILEV